MQTPSHSIASLIQPLSESVESVSHVLPGDTFGGVALAESAAQWGPLATTAFVRLRATTGGRCYQSVLRFNALGFGTVRTVASSRGASDAGIMAALEGAEVIVVLSSDPADVRALDGAASSSVVHRSAERLRYFETETLRLVRFDGDASPTVWERFLDGDFVARATVDASARADLFALVALAGGDVAVH